MSERGDLRDRYLRTPDTPKAARSCNQHTVCDCIAWERQWYFDRMKLILDVVMAAKSSAFPFESLAVIEEVAKGAHPSELTKEIAEWRALEPEVRAIA